MKASTVYYKSEHTRHVVVAQGWCCRWNEAGRSDDALENNGEHGLNRSEALGKTGMSLQVKKKKTKKTNTKALQSLQSKQSSNCIQSLVWDNLVVSWPGLIGAIADETQAHLVAETCTTTFKLVAPRLANGLWHDYLWWFGAYEKRCSETEILNKQCYVIFSFEFFIYHPYSGHLHDTVCTADVLRLDY